MRQANNLHPLPPQSTQARKGALTLVGPLVAPLPPQLPTCDSLLAAENECPDLFRCSARSHRLGREAPCPQLGRLPSFLRQVGLFPILQSTTLPPRLPHKFQLHPPNGSAMLGVAGQGILRDLTLSQGAKGLMGEGGLLGGVGAPRFRPP